MPSLKEVMLGSLFAGVVETVSACAAFPQSDINPWERTTRAFGNTRSDALFFQPASDYEINFPKMFGTLALLLATVLLMKKVAKKIDESLMSMSP